MAMRGQIVILGSGVPEVEALVTAAVQQHPQAAHVTLRFDAGLAQRIYAASDFFLMPSRFEPCGLGQLIAMRYGALPIVRDTGGLHDTVRDVRHDPTGTGLVFSQPTAEELRATLQAALRLWNEHDTLVAARQRAMHEDVSWIKSARIYDQLYAHA
jgi:starch synthase